MAFLGIFVGAAVTLWATYATVTLTELAAGRVFSSALISSGLALDKPISGSQGLAKCSTYRFED
jgi:hypothetical protein